MPKLERDAWFDAVLGLDAVGGVLEDGPELPRGCVPYLPSPVDALIRCVDAAAIRASDVVVDVGAGLGRAAAFLRLSSGASVVGVEIQRALLREARGMVQRVGLSRVTFLEGDGVAAIGEVGEARAGTVFFLYCPFSGERLERLLDGIEGAAREGAATSREIRVCALDVVLPARRWLAQVSPVASDLGVWRCVL